MIESESVFGDLKNNRGFRRFLRRGLCFEKTAIIEKKGCPQVDLPTFGTALLNGIN